jgi:outer membrane protein assembly factor BamB
MMHDDVMENRMKTRGQVPGLLAAVVLAGIQALSGQAADGWLHWRGPFQNGTTLEEGLPSKVGEAIWTYDIRGRGTPVVSDGRMYSWGYKGIGPDLQEYLTCHDPDTGEVFWQLGFNDFLSDTVYDRYTIGSPTVDEETGNIYLMTTAGEFFCVTPQGEIQWIHSMIERYGRLTFPNGRIGAPIIAGDLVIHHIINSYWGADGPARDRFYAFDKKTGDVVWSSTPGVGPKDSSFSSPVLGWANGRRVLYAGTGCGNVICLDVRTGDPIWRFQLSYGGINSSVVVHDNDKVIAISGKENIDDSKTGRMVALRTGREPAEGASGPLVLTYDDELWRNDLCMFTSSPILVGDHVWQVTHTGELVCVDANSGEILSSYKLGTSQLHASPVYGDGKIYIPIISGEFYILEVKGSEVSELDKVTLEGNCIGTPLVYNGKIYVHTTEKLYCFGKPGDNNGLVKPNLTERAPLPEEADSLQIIPADILLEPGDYVQVRTRVLDSNGMTLAEMPDSTGVDIQAFVPPTARVKARMNAEIMGKGLLIASEDPVPSAGAFKATYQGKSGIFRGRILPSIPFNEDFESFEISEAYPEGHVHHGVDFSYPPLPWIGARFKWDIREMEGNKVLAKTLDNVLFQRAITFIGGPDYSEYTVEADVMTDGNRRMKSNVGLINQRYFIYLVGNAQILEVSSNHDRVKQSVPFRWDQKKWYTLKSRVDMNADGSGVVRAKAWPKGEPEPEAWTIEVEHRNAHAKGAPGVYGFSPQARYSVYMDNIRVYPNNK